MRNYMNSIIRKNDQKKKKTPEAFDLLNTMKNITYDLAH